MSTIPVGSFFVGSLAMAMQDPSTVSSAPSAPATSATTTAKAAGPGPGPGPGPKLRAACDECRTKKLKCGGEQPTCSRCTKEGIRCLYSPQKQMGRPKKRQCTDEDNVTGESRSAGMGGSGSMGGEEMVWPGNELISGLGRQNEGAGAGDEGVRAGDLMGEDLLMSGGTALMPWVQGMEWSRPGEDNHGAAAAVAAVPGLTPDSSTGSPPTLNLPPELQTSSSQTTAAITTSGQYTGSTQLLLSPLAHLPDDLNLGLPPSALPACACLSTLYLTLHNLQQMDPCFPFPTALHPLREALQTALSVLSCPHCPTRFLSAIQNTQLTGTLLMSLAERFGKVLSSISAEARRAEEEGEEMHFRLADMNTSTSHLHTGGLGCAAAFSIDLTPAEWRTMCKKVVRAEVFGPGDGNTCCPFLIGVIEKMEGRQKYWHERDHRMPEDFPRDEAGRPLGGKHIPKEDHVCLKLCAYARKVVEGFDWT